MQQTPVTADVPAAGAYAKRSQLGRRGLRLVALVCCVAWFGGCAVRERAPDWQLEARAAQERATRADLEGRSRVAAHEWQRAQAAVQRTARAEPLARMALSRCAVAQAALDFSPCAAAKPYILRASPAEQAYARYLLAQAQPDDAALLPSAHQGSSRALAVVLGTAPSGPGSDRALQALRAIDDPLARLIAASVWLRAGALSPEALDLAVQTASAQGWQRPLMAWLTLQARLAEQAGDGELAQRAQLRLQWLLQPSQRSNPTESPPAQPLPSATPR